MNDEFNQNEQELQELEPIKKKSKRKKEKKVLSEAELKIRKAKKTRIAVASFVLLLGVGVVGNWYYENTNLSSTVKPLISSSSSKTLGEAEYVDATTTTQASTENEYFSSARVDRQTARDSTLDTLQAVIDNTDESEDARKEAAEKIAKISSYISIENKIESLVTAKGVKNCIAVINDDGSRVDIIVDVEELSDSIILQIKEIAIEQLGCTFEDVSIIQSK
jgi:stage III sporulation protein AH